ncbi:hypothetical protein N0V83_000883 [Neocucurbitaria cava]|uniref:Uncharacterized protein n=1 Tax=Neocucurbitaria cava TaxID=798079 RepID=A0A9W9CSE7_9PLEO|nr:hypothetical protein N0V83_000883 [Neocucurbitaria cava]
MSTPVPSYEEANNFAPPTTINPSSQPPPLPPTELPPAYAVVDEKATNYTIYGTIIHTPSGPAYQLSSLLDACISRLRIRRLRAEEISRLQAGAPNVSFDNTRVLYEAHDPPFAVNEYFVQGKQSGCLPGVLQLRFGLRRWHVRHLPEQGGRANDIMTCGKRGKLGRVIRERRNEMEPSEWKDTDGTVMATEVLKIEQGGKMPTIELREDLDQTCRELILALWVTRLWAAFGAGTRSMYQQEGW